MRTGVTGAAGHIGYTLVRRLLAEGHEVRVFLREEQSLPEEVTLDIFRGDLLDAAAVRKFVEGLDAVIHAGARIFVNGKKKWQYFRENIATAENVLQAVKEEGCRYVYFSSIHAYDPFPRDEPLDERRPLVTNDRFLYSRSKARAQEAVMQAAAEGLEALVVNPSAVIGRYDYKPSMLGKAILLMAKNKMPALIPGGYNWVDVRDVAEGTVNALEKGRPGEAYLLAGHWESLQGLYELVSERMGRKKKLPVFPVWMARAGIPFMGLAAHIKGEEPLYTQESITILQESNPHVSTDKASRELGYRPRPLQETVEDTLHWFRERKYL